MSAEIIITRIDLKDFPNEEGIRIEKWLEGWKATDRPYQSYNSDAMSLAEMAAWLRSDGWAVYEWRGGSYFGIPDGVRAYRGKPRSVRTKREMQYRREIIKRKSEEYFRNPNVGATDPKSLLYTISFIDLAHST